MIIEGRPQDYKDYRIDETEHYTNALEQYKLSQKCRMAIFDSRLGEDKQEVTRLKKYETISVIPSLFMEEVLELRPYERRWFEVKIPLWYAMEHKITARGIWFCDMDYDNKIGGVLKANKNASSVFF